MTGKYWTLYGKEHIDGLAMFWDRIDSCMQLLKAEWEVNKQEGAEEFKCCMILSNDGGFVALKRAAEDREVPYGDIEKGCQKPAAQQKTTN